MKRATRIAVGLAALVPVMGVTGGVLVAADASARAVAWTCLVVGVVWLVAIVIWALGAPPTHPEGRSGGWAGLGQATYRQSGPGDGSRRPGG